MRSEASAVLTTVGCQAWFVARTCGFIDSDDEPHPAEDSTSCFVWYRAEYLARAHGWHRRSR